MMTGRAPETAAARTIRLRLHDSTDSNDSFSGSDASVSQKAPDDGIASLPDFPSQPSFVSWAEAEDDDSLPL